MNTPNTFGAKMFTRFMRKGWHISFTDSYQDRVCVIPPERLNAQHVFGIYTRFASYLATRPKT